MPPAPHDARHDAPQDGAHDAVALYSALVESAEDAIIVTTADAVITRWNSAASRLYGFEPEEAIGQTLDAVTPPEDAGDLRETIGLLRMGARVESFDLRRVHKSGRIVDVSVTASPIRDESGEMCAISWIERDVTGRRHVERMISHLAFHDPLTGLANRTLLRDRLQNSLDRTRRGGGLVAVIYFDLDDFKEVNDQFGHPAGDRLLQLLATRMQGLLRPEDTLARIGGDEFVVVSDHVPSLESALAIAARLEHALEPPFDFDGARVTVTASFGVAVGDAAMDADRILAHADRAMYSAKARGGASVATFVASVS